MNAWLQELAPLFAGFGEAAIDDLARASTQLEFEEGEIVFHCGDPGDALYVVLSGSLEVVAETSSRERRRLEVIKKGKWVGELCLVNDQPRASAAVALERSSLLRIPATACHRLMLAQPDAKQQLLDTAFARLPSHHLSVNPWFAHLNPDLLRNLDARLHWLHLRGGETLCRQGDAANAVYIVVHGSLEVLLGSDENERAIDLIGRGASVGEMAVLSGEPRSATVRAIRDSDLIKIPDDEFRHLLEEHADVAVNVARTLATRLRHTTRVPQTKRSIRTVAIIPATRSPLPSEFIPSLASALASQHDRVRHITRHVVDAEFGAGAADARFEDEAGLRLSDWLDTQEATHGVVLYECDAEASGWTLLALRQADLILIVARGADRPASCPLDEARAAGADLSRVRQELVVVHETDGTLPTGTQTWLETRAVTRHHHLRIGRSDDYARVARSIGGVSLGVALSGGGARGFAHIGLLQALRERGIAVDIIGGTSMGSVIAAQAALGWDTATMIERNRKAFVECPVVGDLTFPFVALMKGRSTVDLLQGMFGDAQIEDLWLPYFCVSTNLSRAKVVVHERGPLWLWVRASCSVPGIGPPVPRDGDLLVDGGLLNNLPVDILRTRCPGPLIASDASPSVDLTTEIDTCAEMSGWAQLRRALNPWSRAAAFPNVFEILLRSAAMSSDHSLDEMKKEADLYLHPKVDQIASLDWGAIERVVEIGYQHACERIDQWQKKPASQPAFAQFHEGSTHALRG